jgi:membrane associated rhomboid family serine protease
VKLRITYNAPVVLTFTIAAVVAFLITQAVPSTVEWFRAYPSLSFGTKAYVGLFSHILGHESWEHLLGNFMLILLIGPILEERHGSVRLLVMILVTALVTGLANLAVSSGFLLGASGIVFMMILLASMANVRSGEIPLTFIAVAVIYLGGEIVKEFTKQDNVSHMAHLIGGAVGAVFGFVAAGRRGAPAKAKAPIDLNKLKI